MDNLALAELLFPDVTEDLEALEARFPARDLSADAMVTRLGPSPTGYMHIGNLYGAMIDERLAHQSGGVFFLRIEDTDDKRQVEGAEEVIWKAFRYFGVNIDEGALAKGDVGAYGPYRQSERVAIYHVVARHLVANGFAYPSFATEEELEEIRKAQEAEKVDFGYYGRWATDRHLSLTEIQEKISAHIPWTLRLRSRALPDHVKHLADGIRSSVVVHPNQQDIVLLKTNGVPTYHFAHVVDDHLMRVTHVIRGEEWLATLPVHLELFEILGWTAPTYCHTAHLMKQDEGTRRKLSKRKDPEMSLSYYMEKGYYPESVREYIMVLINSNYEEWRLANPDTPLTEFPVALDKMATSGALYDMVKLNDVAKETLVHVPAETLADFLITWAETYRLEAAPLLKAARADLIRLLDIGRDGKKPRKDLIYAEQMLEFVAYYFDEWFQVEDPLPTCITPELAIELLDAYSARYSETEDNGEWFAGVRDIAEAFGFAAKPKDYKKNPDQYRGHVGDVSAVIRLAVTGRQASPDLWSVQQILGEVRVKERIKRYQTWLSS